MASEIKDDIDFIDDEWEEDSEVCTNPLKKSKVREEGNSVIVVLTDTLSSERITDPVTGSNCVHPHNYFDKNSFIKSGLTTCPVCSVATDSNSLILDSKFQSILPHIPSSITRIRLFEDYHWEPLSEDLSLHSLSINNNNNSSSSPINSVQSLLENAKTKRDSLPFRIKVVYNNKPKFVTINSLRYHELLSCVMKRFPKSIATNDDSAKIKLFHGKTEILEDSDDIKKIVDGDVIDVVSESVLSSLANFPSSMVRWFWWDDDSRWKPYNKADSDLIEAAYAGGKVDSVSLVGGLYKVNISARNQVRPNTGKVRTIVRGCWFWTSDNWALVPYDEKFSAKLEGAYEAVQKESATDASKKVVIDTKRYCMVKKNSTRQYNTTGTTEGRPVKRGFNQY